MTAVLLICVVPNGRGSFTVTVNVVMRPDAPAATVPTDRVQVVPAGNEPLCRPLHTQPSFLPSAGPVPRSTVAFAGTVSVITVLGAATLPLFP